MKRILGSWLLVLVSLAPAALAAEDDTASPKKDGGS